jgi:hypothetical protein
MGNHFLVLQKVKEDDPASLQACKILANYMQVRELPKLRRRSDDSDTVYILRITATSVHHFSLSACVY